MKLDQKGSAMVEATLIIPVIISTVILIIHILMTLYLTVEDNCMLHRSLLEEASKRQDIGAFIRKIDFIKGMIK